MQLLILTTCLAPEIFLTYARTEDLKSIRSRSLDKSSIRIDPDNIDIEYSTNPTINDSIATALFDGRFEWNFVTNFYEEDDGAEDRGPMQPEEIESLLQYPIHSLPDFDPNTLNTEQPNEDDKEAIQGKKNFLKIRTILRDTLSAEIEDRNALFNISIFCRYNIITVSHAQSVLNCLFLLWYLEEEAQCLQRKENKKLAAERMIKDLNTSKIALKDLVKAGVSNEFMQNIEKDAKISDKAAVKIRKHIKHMNNMEIDDFCTYLYMLPMYLMEDASDAAGKRRNILIGSFILLAKALEDIDTIEIGQAIKHILNRRVIDIDIHTKRSITEKTKQLYTVLTNLRNVIVSSIENKN